MNYVSAMEPEPLTDEDLARCQDKLLEAIADPIKKIALQMLIHGFRLHELHVGKGPASWCHSPLDGACVNTAGGPVFLRGRA